eukprot:SAG31_NODE_1096_length_9920_cov_14.794216_5_plen_76_part_00
MYWPVTNSSKIVLFLGELEELLELTQPTEWPAIIDPLFYRISCCLMSPHFQVCGQELQHCGGNRNAVLPSCGSVC